jgi:hypothetical protein
VRPPLLLGLLLAAAPAILGRCGPAAHLTGACQAGDGVGVTQGSL